MSMVLYRGERLVSLREVSKIGMYLYRYLPNVSPCNNVNVKPKSFVRGSLSRSVLRDHKLTP
jgi:hypothetical protein